MGVFAAIVVVVVLVALVVWYRSYRVRSEPPPPELTGEEPEPPGHRSDEWNPQQRYGDG
jgi:hypothetical protein